MTGKPTTGSRQIGWYDRVAPLYDASMMGDWFYRDARGKIFEELGPLPGQTCFVFFCGTGFDLPLIAGTMHPAKVVGIDGSEAMLHQAQRRAASLATSGIEFDFLQSNSETDDGLAHVIAAIEEHRPAALVYSLGLTCLPSWRRFFLRTFDAAPSGAKAGILDVHSPQPGAGKTLIDFIGSAETSRPAWEELEKRSDSYRCFEFHPFRPVDVKVFTAVGEKMLDNVIHR
ncbi:class I SAM-dependent methyltransferase [Devosia sp. Naph2]|uniref:class I SAM-dependent methyltransferase n=1 Tax=Devosia polycyclovorans TaxID=3345148 RepID=UPI0035CEAB5F